MNILHGSKLFILIITFLFSSAITLLWFVVTKLPTRLTADKEVSKFYFPRHQLVTPYLDNLSTQSNHSISITSAKATSSHWKHVYTRASISSQHNLSSQFNNWLSENIHPELKPKNSNLSKTSINSGCKVPPGGFKSWNNGVVTKLTPDIRANCTLFFNGDKFEIERVQNASHAWPIKKYTLNFTNWVKERDCTQYKKELYDNLYMTKDELAFPLAFTLIVHNSPFQVFRLMKVIYRPNNIYCIHYDRRSSQEVKLFFNNLAMCFGNIITPNNITEVHWGHHLGKRRKKT